MSDISAIERANEDYELNGYGAPVYSSGGWGSPAAAATAASGGSWLAQLQPASWRGLAFGVRESSIKRGRKTAVHEYPYRDDVWVEDLGRGTRSISFRGFLVGDDVYAQRDAMVAAAEQAGSGEVVHPSLGSRTASLIEFEAAERMELGRVVELSFVFIETGQPLYPSDATSTQDTAENAADDADDAAAGDFGSDVADALSAGAEVVQTAVSTVQGFAGQVLELGGDARMVLDAVNALPGNFGRYATGGVGTLLAASSTVQTVLAAATTARTAVSSAVSSVVDLAEGL
jgi:prophage DNA circulation protein